jgi:hypothetical protein
VRAEQSSICSDVRAVACQHRRSTSASAPRVRGSDRERVPTLEAPDGSASSSVDLGTVSRASSLRSPAAIITITWLCDDCGKVEPFEDPTLEAAIERVADGRGYAVVAHDVVLRGACEDCRPHEHEVGAPE